MVCVEYSCVGDGSELWCMKLLMEAKVGMIPEVLEKACL